MGRQDALAYELREANERLVLAAVREQALAERARHEAADTDALVEHLDAGVLLLDRAMQIRLMNESSRALFGGSAGCRARDSTLSGSRSSRSTARGCRCMLAVSAMLGGHVFSDCEVVLVRRTERAAACGRLPSWFAIAAGRSRSPWPCCTTSPSCASSSGCAKNISRSCRTILRSPLSGVSLFSSLLERVLLAKGLPVEAANAGRILKNARHSRRSSASCWSRRGSRAAPARCASPWSTGGRRRDVCERLSSAEAGASGARLRRSARPLRRRLSAQARADQPRLQCAQVFSG